MGRSTWTAEQDYALTFGAALGMTASQIAGQIGSITRNAVIGRSNRLGLSLSGNKNRQAAIRSEKAAAPKPERRKRNSTWTADEDTALAVAVAARKTSNDIAKELGRTESAIHARRGVLGLRQYSTRLFTPDEDQIIRERHAAFVPVDEIAKSLNRTTGSLKQRIFHLGLHRDGRKVKLAARYGLDILNLSDDPGKIQEALKAKKQQEKEARDAEHVAEVEAALSLMKEALIRGEDRAIVYRAALIRGATLQQIGDIVGVTRERVRQIVDDVKPQAKPRPPRTLKCARCGNEFTAVGRGPRKYCEPCAPIAAAEAQIRRSERMKIYMSAYRAKPDYLERKRNWTRQDRLRKKLNDLPPADLANLLRRVASDVEVK